MTKGYIFPKRSLRDEEILEPAGLNEDLLPAVDRLSGGLNEHNFNAASVRANVEPSTAAYYKVHHVFKESDPNFGVPGAYTAPNSVGGWGHDLPCQIPNSFEWNVLDGMSITLNSGNAVLWIVGWLQYVWLGFAVHSHTYSLSSKPARVQFAIRLDGAVIEATITGQKDPAATAWQVTKAVSQRTGTSLLPGPQVDRNIGDNAAIGPECLPVRLGVPVPISQGSHTIELVARRIYPSDWDQIFTSSDQVWVYNRRLFVLETYIEPQVSVGMNPVTIQAFDVEDIFSAAEIETNRVGVVETASNDVVNGMEARGAFNHSHLPNAVHDHDTRELAPAAFQISDARYPGFDAHTFTANKHAASTGWYLMDDGAGVTLSTNSGIGPHGAWDTTTKASFILVLANIHIPQMTDHTTYKLDNFGAFAIGYTSAGTPLIALDTVGYANSYAYDDGFCANGSFKYDTPQELDIPLMYCMDVSVPLAANIDSFGVYVSSFNGDGIAVDLSWLRGNLIVLQFRI
jgi:hypothetical protein